MGRRVGRPKLKPEERQAHKYTKMAVYKKTHKRIKKNAEQEDISMLDYLEKEIK